MIRSLSARLGVRIIAPAGMILAGMIPASMVLASMVLAGCSAPVQMRLDPQIQPPPPSAIPTIQPLVLDPVPWTVYNRAALEALVARMRAQNDTRSIIFALDPNGLQNLKLNFIELQRYITEQKAVIVLLIKIVEQHSHVVEAPGLASARATAAPDATNSLDK